MTSPARRAVDPAAARSAILQSAASQPPAPQTAPAPTSAPATATTAPRRRATGPRTAAGKAVSAMNALRHGVYARAILLPGEDAAAFASLRDDLMARWQPSGDGETVLVERLLALTWRRQRIAFAEAGLLAQGFAEERFAEEGCAEQGVGEAGAADSDDDSAVDPLAVWERLSRLEARLDNAIDRTIRELKASRAAASDMRHMARLRARALDRAAQGKPPTQTPAAYLARLRDPAATIEAVDFSNDLEPRPTPADLRRILDAIRVRGRGLPGDIAARTAAGPDADIDAILAAPSSGA